VRDTDKVSAEKRPLEMVKVIKYDHWKRKDDGVMLAAIEGEADGKHRRGGKRTEWVDNIRQWRDGMEHA